MLKVFSSLKTSLKVKLDPAVEGAVFKLHYRLTVVILLASCVLVCSRSYIGEHIQCLQTNKSPIPKNVINTYCFIMSTFSIPKHYGKKVGEEVVHDGVGPHTPEDEVKYHAYYQWVPFVLFVQALMFYVPHLIWKHLEGGKLRAIMVGLHQYVLEDTKRKDKEAVLCRYIMDTLHDHNKWALGYTLCEFLNLVNVIGNIYFTDTFLGGEFTTYGTKVVGFLEKDPEVRTDPMSRVFPRVTKCTFHKFGPSGTVQQHDALCILALNIINEKIYTFLWFWFVILAVITALSLLYRLAVLLLPDARVVLLRTRGHATGRINLDLITQKCQYGDWFLLYHLGRNMDSIIYCEFLKELAQWLNHGGSTLEVKRLLDKPKS